MDFSVFILRWHYFFFDYWGEEAAPIDKSDMDIFALLNRWHNTTHERVTTIDALCYYRLMEKKSAYDPRFKKLMPGIPRADTTRMVQQAARAGVVRCGLPDTRQNMFCFYWIHTRRLRLLHLKKELPAPWVPLTPDELDAFTRYVEERMARAIAFHKLETQSK